MHEFAVIPSGGSVMIGSINSPRIPRDEGLVLRNDSWGSTAVSVRKWLSSVWMWTIVLMGDCFLWYQMFVGGFSRNGSPGVNALPVEVGPLLTWTSCVLVLAGLASAALGSELHVYLFGPRHGPISPTARSCIIGFGVLGLILGLFSLVAELAASSFDWQRGVMLLEWVPLSFFRFDLIAIPASAAALMAASTALGCCCGAFHMCGRARFGQRALRSLHGRDPLVDLVENRTAFSMLTPFIFVCAPSSNRTLLRTEAVPPRAHPPVVRRADAFALPSLFALTGSALVWPKLALPSDEPTPSQAATLRPLCKDPLWSLGAELLDQSGGPSGPLGWALLHAGWRTILEQPQPACPGGLHGHAKDSNQTWLISAALAQPPGHHATVPTIRLALRSAERLGVAGANVSAAVTGFGGQCDDEGDHASGEPSAASHESEQRIPAITGPAWVATDSSGVAELALTLDTTGCSAGLLQIELTADAGPDPSSPLRAPPLHVHLFERPSTNRTYTRSSEVELPTADPLKVTMVSSTVRVETSFSSVRVLATTSVNETRFDANGSVVNSTIETSEAEQLSNDVPGLLYVCGGEFGDNSTFPPQIAVGRDLSVRACAVDLMGQPVPGQLVKLALLAPNGSRALLAGERTGVTDATGAATLRFRFIAGRAANYTLVLSGGDDLLSSWQRQPAAVVALGPRALAQLRSGDAQVYLDAVLDAQLDAATDGVYSGARQCAVLPDEDKPACLAKLAAGAPAAVLATTGLAAITATLAGGAAANVACGAGLLGSSTNVVLAAGLGAGATSVTTIPGIGDLVQYILDAAFGSLVDAANDVIAIVRGAVEDGSLEAAAPFAFRVALLNRAGEGSVELTAPLVGYGVAVASTSTWSAAGMSSCSLAGYPRYASVGTSGGGVLGPPASEAQRALWQPWPFSALNWQLDAGVPDVAAAGTCAGGRQGCKHLTQCRTSFISSGMMLPSHHLAGGDLTAERLSDGFGDEEAGLARRAMELASSATGPDPHQPDLSRRFDAMERAGLALNASGPCSAPGFCEAALAANAALTDREAICEPGWSGCLRTAGDEGIRHWTAAPRVLVRDADGQPLVGSSCWVEDEGNLDLPYIEFNALRLSAACERGPAAGTWEVRSVFVGGGGSSRELRLAVFVDGIRATPANDSWWHFDTEVQLESQSQLTLRRLDVLLLSGHDSFKLLGFLCLPLFSLNTMGRRARSLPGAVARVVGMSILLLMIWYHGSWLWLFFNGDPDRRAHRLVALGRNDLAGAGSSRSPLAVVAAWAMSLFVTVPIFMLFFWLQIIWVRLGGSINVGGRGRAVKQYARNRAKWEEEQRLATGLAARFSDSLWREPDGAMEPAGYLESSAMIRLRCARNHVRLLLRPASDYEARLAALTAKKQRGGGRPWRGSAPTAGPRTAGRTSTIAIESPRPGALQKALSSSPTVAAVRAASAKAVAPAVEYTRARFAEAPAKVIKATGNRRLPLEAGPFFYPQRLLMACGLSLWITFMLALVTCNVMLWMDAVISAGRAACVSLDGQAAHTSDLPLATRYSITALVTLLQVDDVLGQGRKAYEVVRAVVGVLVWVVPLVPTLVILYNWYFIFAAFKRHTYLMRQGTYFFERRLFRAEYANRYIGYQVSAMTGGFLLILFFGLSIAVPISAVVLSALGVVDIRIWQDTLDALAGIPLALLLAVPVFFQIFMDRFVFFRNGWVILRPLYAIYDYCLIYTNVILGIVAVAARLLSTVFCSIVFFPRLDMSSMPHPDRYMHLFDVGFVAYVAMLKLDHQYNNPVVVVFFEIMLDHHREASGRRKLRRLRDRLRDGRPHPHASHAKFPGAQALWRRCWRRVRDHRRHARQRARNRWQLARILLANPHLRLFRGGRNGRTQLETNNELLEGRQRSAGMSSGDSLARAASLAANLGLGLACGAAQDGGAALQIDMI